MPLAKYNNMIQAIPLIEPIRRSAYPFCNGGSRRSRPVTNAHRLKAAHEADENVAVDGVAVTDDGLR